MYLKNNIRGFTLVELAIVLVVIGLLLAMVVKGKSLIDASKIKVELNKISKIESAVNTYITRYNRLPGFDGTNNSLSPDNVSSALLKEGLVSQSDLEAFESTEYWTFVGCKNENAATGNDAIWVPGRIDKSHYLCIYLSKNQPSNDINSNGLIQNQFESSFVCQIETTLDDKTVFGGQGRVNNFGYRGPMQNNEFKCSDSSINQSQSMGGYIYRVW